MGNFSYSIAVGEERYKVVDGEQINTVFAMRKENGGGWRITHLPTGYMFMRGGFPTKEEALAFAMETYAILGNDLLSNDPLVIRNLKHKSRQAETWFRYIDTLSEYSRRGLLLNEHVVTEAWIRSQ